MNIIVDAGGQTCNRFFEFIYYLKKAIITGEKVKVLIPDVTIEDFPILKKNKYISFPLYNSFWTRLFGLKRNIRIIKFLKKVFINKKLHPIYKVIFFNKLKFVKGQDTWFIDEDYSDVKLIFRELFKVNNNIQRKVDTYFENNINNKSIVIGIHIRWGDYKIWKNGKYFFTEDIYFEYMKKIQKELGEEQNISFIISSNSKIDINKFKPLKCFQMPQSSAAEDLYALSKCDYIIGPVSTFSSWVSFLYEIPLYCITAKDDYKTMRLIDFSATKNFLYKRNGYQFDRS
jgi:hypothetical protein